VPPAVCIPHAVHQTTDREHSRDAHRQGEQLLQLQRPGYCVGQREHKVAKERAYQDADGAVEDALGAHALSATSCGYVLSVAQPPALMNVANSSTSLTPSRAACMNRA
jgi:hypothetical protein